MKSSGSRQQHGIDTAVPGEEWRAVAEKKRRDLTESGIWGVPAFRIGDAALWGQHSCGLCARRVLTMSEGSGINQ
jgi:2-hydroxychromene-2-carboxylate isomerase